MAEAIGVRKLSERYEEEKSKVYPPLALLYTSSKGHVFVTRKLTTRGEDIKGEAIIFYCPLKYF